MKNSQTLTVNHMLLLLAYTASIQWPSVIYKQRHFGHFQLFLCCLQAIDSIHQVGLYCLALVPANTLPKTPLGGIHISDTKQFFLDGNLHPCNILMCPHTCVTNLPKPRQKQPGRQHLSAADPPKMRVTVEVPPVRVTQGHEVFCEIGAWSVVLHNVHT